MINLNNKILVYFNKYTNKVLQLETVEFMQGFLKKESIECFNLANGIEDDSTSITILNQEDYSDLFVNGLTNIISYDSESNKLIVNYRMQEGGNSSERFYWNNHNPQRQYTEQEALDIYYNDYLNFNLKNVLRSNNNINIEFLPLDKLILDEDIMVKDWEGCFQDPFLDAYDYDKIALGKSILEKGTYFPCMVFLDYDMEYYHVREGNHRVASLKLCQLMGLVPDNFKICCIILPRDLGVNVFTNTYNYNLLKPLKARYILECFWTPKVIEDQEYLEIVKKNLKEQEHELLNDYLVEYKITTYMGLFEAIHAFPLFLRDLFFHYENIKPALIINDENEFKKWLLFKEEKEE